MVIRLFQQAFGKRNCTAVRLRLLPCCEQWNAHWSCEAPSIMLNPIFDILRRCDSESPIMPPTALFNEGWMLRLVMNRFSRDPMIEHPLAFRPKAKWFSEALLPTRFKAEGRGDHQSEKHTHADGVIGHITLAQATRWGAELSRDAKQFVVIEAKLGSRLDSRTRNAPGYDQAARNVACMAYMLGEANIEPSSMDSLAFYVITPEARIKAGKFVNLVNKESIEQKVKNRVAAYGGKHDVWFNDKFLPVINRITLEVLSWEEILRDLAKKQEISDLTAFYDRCKEYNL